MNTSTLTTRPLTRRDYKRCAEIDGEWSEADFCRHDDGLYYGAVTECKGYAVGFAVWKLPEFSLQMVRLGLDDRYMGVDGELLGHVKRKASYARRKAVTCGVFFESVNLNDLLRLHGFRAVGWDRDRELVILECRV